MVLLALVATVVLSQTDVDAGTPILNVATTRFVGVNLGDAETAFYTEQFAQGLLRAGSDATSPKQFENLLMMARQRSLIGECDDEQIDCQSEMANAVGADALAIGEIAKLERTEAGGRSVVSYRISVRIIDARTSVVLTSATAIARSTGEIVDQLHASAKLMAPIAARKSGKTIRAPKVEAPPRPPPNNRTQVFAMTAGGIVAVGGAALLYTAIADANAIRNGTSGHPNVGAARDAGAWANWREFLGWTAISAGLLTATLGFTFYERPATAPTAAIWIGANGAGFAISGALP